MSKTLSIIVPIYNTAPYLDNCLSHLVSQNLTTLKSKDIEILCIDDCSQDNSASIAKSWSQKDSRIKFLSTSHNSGAASVRNLGLATAQGDFIMFCDGDDYYDPDMCETMYQTILQQKVDLVTCPIHLIYHTHSDQSAHDAAYYSFKFFGRKFLQPSMLPLIDASMTNKIFRRSLIQKYHLTCPDKLHFEDAFFVPAYLMVARSIYFLDRPLYNYLRHDNSCMTSLWSSSNPTSDYASEHLDIAFKLWQFMQKHHLTTTYNSAFWQLYAIYMPSAICNSKSNSLRRQTRRRSKHFVRTHKKFFKQSYRFSKFKIFYFHHPINKFWYFAWDKIVHHLPRPMHQAKTQTSLDLQALSLTIDQIRMHIE